MTQREKVKKVKIRHFDSVEFDLSHLILTPSTEPVVVPFENSWRDSMEWEREREREWYAKDTSEREMGRDEVPNSLSISITYVAKENSFHGWERRVHLIRGNHLYHFPDPWLHMRRKRRTFMQRIMLVVCLHTPHHATHVCCNNNRRKGEEMELEEWYHHPVSPVILSWEKERVTSHLLPLKAPKEWISGSEGRKEKKRGKGKKENSTWWFERKRNKFKFWNLFLWYTWRLNNKSDDSHDWTYHTSLHFLPIYTSWGELNVLNIISQ